MKKHIYLLPTAALAIAVLFAGCAGSKPAAPSSAASVTSVSAASSTASGQKTFTLSELKQYNGKNGNPAYIAVNGVVYDVTNAKDWSGGSHHGYTAGQDLTQAIQQSPHGTSVLKSLPIIGKLQ